WPMHIHEDLQAVTCVVEGALEHSDSLGNHGVLAAGGVQQRWLDWGFEQQDAQRYRSGHRPRLSSSRGHGPVAQPTFRCHLPPGWFVELPEQHLVLTVTPLLPDKELYSPGAVFAGRRTGRARSMSTPVARARQGVWATWSSQVTPRRIRKSVANTPAAAAGTAGTED